MSTRDTAGGTLTSLRAHRWIVLEVERGERAGTPSECCAQAG